MSIKCKQNFLVLVEQNFCQLINNSREFTKQKANKGKGGLSQLKSQTKTYFTFPVQLKIHQFSEGVNSCNN